MLKSKKLLLALLLPVFALALSFGAYAFAEDVIIDGDHYTAEEWAAKQQMNQQMIEESVVIENLQEGPVFFNPAILEDVTFRYEEGTVPSGPAIHTMAPMDDLKVNLYEMFFNDGAWPPTEGSVIENNVNGKFWQLNDGSGNPTHEGPYGSNIPYDGAATSDEWIITDPITIDATYNTLTFAWMTGYVWMVTPNPNGDMWVKITTDGGTTWTNLWREDDYGIFPDYIADYTEYNITNLDLSAYDGQTVQIGFNYVADDADGFYLDWISVNDGAAPVGRCCYGDPGAPSCVDDTQANCQALTDYISWDGGLDCTTPCPIAGANDNCDGAVVVGPTFPATVSGTTVGSTVDCPGVLDWQAVWYTFNNPYTCANLTVEWCGTTPEPVTIGVVVYDACPLDCSAYILYSVNHWGDGLECTDGNPITEFWQLPAGDYWYPAFTGPGTYGGTPQDFQLTFNLEECPEAPDNDECANAIEIPSLPATVSGSTIGATVDCPGVLDWNAVWYYFEVPSFTYGADLLVDYCPSLSDISNIGLVLYAGSCPVDCNDYVLRTGYDFYTCSSGTKPIVWWNYLPAGTYYLPVYTGDSKAPQDFIFDISVTASPEPVPGDNCADPIKVTINSSGDLPYTDANYTCGRGDSENATCLSSYDGGEDLFYEVEVGATMTLKFTLDPQGTTWAGMGLGSSCPPAGTTYTDCLAETHGSSGTAKSFQIELTPGTYYLMIDTYPSPDCIPALTLLIEEYVVTPGDDCTDPIKINLPADAPYADNNYTCGRGDFIDATCLSYYDGGEDIFYEVNVDVAGYYEFTENPNGTTYVGMVLSTTCPAGGSTYTDCFAEYHTSGSTPGGFVIFLDPGTYYLMIDTWPSPDCIPDFDLTINYLLPPSLTYDATTIEFCNVNPDETGCFTLNLGNEGDIDLDWNIAIDYGIPPTKSIAGSNLSTTHVYTPGATEDVTFSVSWSTADAEWITDLILEFPAGVYVNSAQDVVCSSGNMVYDGSFGDGATVTWSCDDPPYGCMYDGDTEDFIVNATFDAGLVGPVTVNYTLIGDGWGSDPHTLSGNVTLASGGPYDPYTSWLSVDVSNGAIAGSGSQAIQVCYNSTDIVNGVYFGSLILTHNGGLSPITIPVTMNVGPDHIPSAVLAIDRSGSMALEDAFGDTRFLRAKNMAHVDADVLITDGYQVSVVAFNSTGGIAVVQDFTTDLGLVNDAIDAIGDPRHDTPLAAAMCQAHCTLYTLGCGIDALYTYTDGEENESLDFDMCYICDACYQYSGSGWNYDCNPANPGTCTEWQLCLADVFANNGMNVVNYFGSPINPFAKGSQVPEDIYFLKYTADASDGEFNYFADAQYICGDANSDSRVNVSDAVFIINYVFSAGDAPQPLEAAEVNCDSKVNVSDAVYLINFVFAGGSAPCACGE